MSREPVLAEEALGEFPVGRQLAGLLHQGVYPGDAAGDVGVFDAVAGVGVVFHDLAGAAAALGVDLEEDGGSGAGDADAVLVDEAFDHHRVNDGLEKGYEVRITVMTDGAVYERRRDEAELLWF